METASTSLTARPGLSVSWLLASPIRSFNGRADGKPRTVVELRDPQRLGNSLLLFVPGEAPQEWSRIPTTMAIAVTVEEVRSGKGRGELFGTISREALAEALSPFVARVEVVES